MRRIYLDNGSTSFPKAPGVGQAMADYIDQLGVNVGRGGYDSAYEAGEMLLETRRALADMFHFPEPKNVVFTPSVTYSLNFVIRGFLRPGDHAIISGMEHNAVARPMHDVRDRGVDVTVVPCSQTGQLDYEAFAASFRDNTRLVVMAHASNVCGSCIDPVRVGRICREKGVPFVLDAAQSAGVLPIDFEDMGLSALCLPGHKGLLGPQGIGVLMLTSKMAQELTPVISGGTGSASHLLTMPDFMPDRFEPGTFNLPGIAGLARALSFLRETGIDRIRENELDRARQFMDGVRDLPGVRIVGPGPDQERVGVVSLDFADMDNAMVSYLLDSEYGISTRCGLHCAPLAHKSLGTYPKGTVRFGFGWSTTEKETDSAVRAVEEIVRGN